MGGVVEGRVSILGRLAVPLRRDSVGFHESVGRGCRRRAGHLESSLRRGVGGDQTDETRPAKFASSEHQGERWTVETHPKLPLSDLLVAARRVRQLHLVVDENRRHLGARVPTEQFQHR
jgi:hypothetical protein